MPSTCPELDLEFLISRKDKVEVPKGITVLCATAVTTVSLSSATAVTTVSLSSATFLGTATG
jgi:hypothetical protein